jgi:hypothetical protein
MPQATINTPKSPNIQLKGRSRRLHKPQQDNRDCEIGECDQQIRYEVQPYQSVIPTIAVTVRLKITGREQLSEVH